MSYPTSRVIRSPQSAGVRRTTRWSLTGREKHSKVVEALKLLRRGRAGKFSVVLESGLLLTLVGEASETAQDLYFLIALAHITA